jgi:hypothetical protein
MPYVTGPLGPDGAIVEIFVGVTDARRQALVRNNFPVPARVAVKALLDTGASGTVVRAEALKALGQQPLGVTKASVPSPAPGAQEFEEHAVSIGLIGPGGLEAYHPLVAGVLACYFEEQEPYHALLGRDVLDHCLLVYDGPNQVFSLAF